MSRSLLPLYEYVQGLGAVLVSSHQNCNRSSTLNSKYLKENDLTEFSFISGRGGEKNNKKCGRAQGLVSFQIIDAIKSQTKRGGR